MRFAQIAFATLLAAASAAYLYFVSEIEIGNLGEPGPGFTPALIGAAALLCALLILASALRGGALAKGEAVDRAGLLRFGVCLLATVLFVPVFVKLGAVLALFLLVLAMTRLLGEERWVPTVVLAAASAAATYFVFVRMLDVPLPRGIL